MNNIVSLNNLPPGKQCIVRALGMYGEARRRISDLGLVCGTVVKAVQKSPSGDPVAYLIRGAVIALRSEEAALILVEII
ncbi:MAG: FeoA domain protein [Firmicutes bacterium ADurb.Bin193]|nr:MAG: FeoA domain protein [Firmicutes bacterium ADurb.Bin193]